MSIRAIVPKLFKRGNRWYIRVQVPIHMQSALKRKEKWVSLRTSDRNKAIQSAAIRAAEQRWEDERVYRMKIGLRYPIERFDEQQLLALGREAYDLSLGDEEDSQAKFQASGQETYAEFVQVQRKAVENLSNILHSSGGHHPLIDMMMIRLGESNGIQFSKGSDADAQLRRICIDVCVEANRRIISRLQSREIPENADPRFVDPTTGENRPFEPLIKQMSKVPTMVTLTELVDEYLKDPSKLRTEKTKKSVRGFLAVVIDIIGDTTQVADISRQDCLNVRKLIIDLPPNFKKRKQLENRPVEEQARIARKLNMPKLSPTGVNNYLNWMHSFLTWCVAMDYLDKVPVGLGMLRVADPVRKRDKRLAFTDDHLSTIFHSEVYATGQRGSALFWVPLIALWNGMRSNEICQLDAADIRQVEDVWGFDITHISVTGNSDKRTKTGGSIRFIPIHHRLLEFGLLDFHAIRPPTAKLFGDITVGSDGYYSTNFSKKSNRYLQKIGVHGPKHKFHSFRHTFRDALRVGRVDPEIGKALGGWQGSNTDAFDIYGTGFPLEELASELKRVDYPKVDWDHLVTR